MKMEKESVQMRNHSKGTLTLSPLGGLANRMRAILAADTLCREVGSELKVVWMRESGLNARFCDLFQPLSVADVQELGAKDYLLYAPPLKRNLFIPSIPQKLRFDTTLFDWHLPVLQQNPEELAAMLKGKNVFVASGLGFFPTNDALFAQYFKPLPSLMEEVGQRTAAFGDQTVGVHIRRTDNAMSIQCSPIEAFVERMEAFPATTNFYLATDDERVKSLMSEKFPHRVWSSPFEADRNSLEGMREAVVEMFSLAKTSHFLGSYYSSFSDIIVAMNQHGEIVVKK